MIAESVSHDILVDGSFAPVRMYAPFGADPKFCSNAAAVYGELQDNCLVRIHSKCMYSEVFASRECDCGWQLRKSRELLTQKGGVLIYLDQEGRGSGLQAKASAYRMHQEEDLDTFAAYEKLQLPADSRDYTEAVQILKELGLRSVKLLTNNPGKIEALEAAGITVTRMPLQANPTPATVAYLRAKRLHGHLLLPSGPLAASWTSRRAAFRGALSPRVAPSHSYRVLRVMCNVLNDALP
jgi:GTP cyclohydrolase II